MRSVKYTGAGKRYHGGKNGITGYGDNVGLRYAGFELSISETTGAVPHQIAGRVADAPAHRAEPVKACVNGLGLSSRSKRAPNERRGRQGNAAEVGDGGGIPFLISSLNVGLDT